MEHDQVSGNGSRDSQVFIDPSSIQTTPETKTTPQSGHGKIADKLSSTTSHGDVSTDGSGSTTDTVGRERLGLGESKTECDVPAKIATKTGVWKAAKSLLNATKTVLKAQSKIVSLKPQIIIGQRDATYASVVRENRPAFKEALSKVDKAQQAYSQAVASNQSESKVRSAKLNLIKAKVDLLHVKKAEGRCSAEELQRLPEIVATLKKAQTIFIEGTLKSVEAQIAKLKESPKAELPGNKERIVELEAKLAGLKNQHNTKKSAQSVFSPKEQETPPLPPRPLRAAKQEETSVPTRLLRTEEKHEEDAPPIPERSSSLKGNQTPPPIPPKPLHLQLLRFPRAAVGEGATLSESLIETGKKTQAMAGSIPKIEISSEEAPDVSEVRTDQAEVVVETTSQASTSYEAVKSSSSHLSFVVGEIFSTEKTYSAALGRMGEIRDFFTEAEISNLGKGLSKHKQIEIQTTVNELLHSGNIEKLQAYSQGLIAKLTPLKQVLDDANNDLKDANTAHQEAIEELAKASDPESNTSTEDLKKAQAKVNETHERIKSALAATDIATKDYAAAFLNTEMPPDVLEAANKHSLAQAKFSAMLINYDLEKTWGGAIDRFIETKNIDNRVEKMNFKSSVEANTPFIPVMQRLGKFDGFSKELYKGINKAGADFSDLETSIEAFKDRSITTFNELNERTRTEENKRELDILQYAITKAKSSNGKLKALGARVVARTDRFGIVKATAPKELAILDKAVSTLKKAIESTTKRFSEEQDPAVQKQLGEELKSYATSLNDLLSLDWSKNLEASRSPPPEIKEIEQASIDISRELNIHTPPENIVIEDTEEVATTDIAQGVSSESLVIDHTSPNHNFGELWHNLMSSPKAQQDFMGSYRSLVGSLKIEGKKLGEVIQDDVQETETDMEDIAAVQPTKSEMLMKLFETQFATASVEEKAQILKMVQQWLKDPYINSGENSPYIEDRIRSMLDHSDFPPELDALKKDIEANLGSVSPVSGQPPIAGTQSFSKLMSELATLKPGSEKYNAAVAFIAADLSSPTSYYLSQLTASEWDADHISKADLKKVHAPNITALTQYTTDITNLIVNTIASQKTPAEAGKVMGFFIDVQSAMLSRAGGQTIDLTGALAIQSAFSKTWIENRLLEGNKAKLSKSQLAKLEENKITFNPTKNYAKLRELTKETGVEAFQVLYGDMERVLTTNEPVSSKKQLNPEVVELYAKTEARLPHIEYTKPVQTSDMLTEMRRINKTPELQSATAEFSQSKFDKEIGKKIETKFPKAT